jgi:integrase
MGWHRAQLAAGIVTPNGKPKYPDFHALRHFYASRCINRRVDGGLELPLKVVQARLGHASIKMTADRYGHKPRDGDETTSDDYCDPKRMKPAAPPHPR